MTQTGRGLFFTGTDTGVGKTHVVCAVARCLREQGRDFAVCKPVATGAKQAAGRWVADDTVRLAEAAGTAAGYEQITPWSFPEEVAPPVAAGLQGVALDLSALVGAVRRLSAPGRLLLVEGVGGLLCPLTERETVADLAEALGFPLVVVARRSLGTLNHTLLTLEVARRRGLAVAGVVVNETQPPRSLAEQTNVEQLRRRVDVPILAVAPFHPSGARDDGSSLARVDWEALSMTPGSAPREGSR